MNKRLYEYILYFAFITVFTVYEMEKYGIRNLNPNVNCIHKTVRLHIITIIVVVVVVVVAVVEKNI